jgi:uncharacterized protein (TIGR02118 family)
MTKIVTLLTRRPGMDPEAFRRYWRETHGPAVAAIPTLRKYVQEHPTPAASDGQPSCDGIANMWFDSPEAFQAALASGPGRAVLVDLAAFCDLTRVRIFAVDEIPFV